MDNRLYRKDVVFEDMPFFDSDEEISVYLSQNENLNKIANTEFPICDFYQTNFYGIYNFNTGDFRVVSLTTLYTGETEIKEALPDIADKVIDASKKDENSLDLTSNELNLVFIIFKDYCKEELSDIVSLRNYIDFMTYIQECYQQLLIM